jgi:hypothetical protein
MRRWRIVKTFRIGAKICGLLTLGLGFVLLSGCGKSKAEVSGKVTIKGAPAKIEGLTVSVMGADGKPVTGTVAGDGQYVIPDAPVGEVMFSISVAGVGQGDRESAGGGDDKPRPGEDPEAFEKRLQDPKHKADQMKKTVEQGKTKGEIPEKYLTPTTSGWKTTLKSGPGNKFDLVVE